LHAITDAVLGATAQGDIGGLFPDTDPANEGRNSADMLQAVVAQIASAGWRIVNLDCIVFTERPKLSPHQLELRQRIADILSLDVQFVSVKAKTGESVGPIGREEAISAQCIVLLESS
jgi:2-C-methyl-D-erythritol 2,4-cyclodiphosphate synthase